MLKVSIITVTRNNAGGLENTLRSIEALESADSFEWIIIDGHSTDNTDALVAENRERIDLFAKDEGSGIYGAMNQGVSLATGEYIIFMNAGDCFADSEVVSRLLPSLTGDLVFGTAVNENDSAQLPFRGLEQPWRRMPFSHQALFARRSLLLMHPFDLKFKIAGDFEFVLWALSEGYEFVETHILVARVERGGVSEMKVFPRVGECYRASRRHCKGFALHLHYLYKYKWALGVILGRIKRRYV
jgi:putative colanic acid biosynthesis glycosyltransferase